MDRLGFLSKEEVERFKQLFLDAIQWYEAHVVEEDKWGEPYLRNVRYSLVPTLKDRVTFGKEIPADEIKLLGVVLQEYYGLLTSLQRQSWVRRETVKGQLDQLDELIKQDLIRISKPKIAVK